MAGKGCEYFEGTWGKIGRCAAQSEETGDVRCTRRDQKDYETIGVRGSKRKETEARVPPDQILERSGKSRCVYVTYHAPLNRASLEHVDEVRAEEELIVWTNLRVVVE